MMYKSFEISVSPWPDLCFKYGSILVWVEIDMKDSGYLRWCTSEHNILQHIMTCVRSWYWPHGHHWLYIYNRIDTEREKGGGQISHNFFILLTGKNHLKSPFFLDDEHI